MEHELHMRPNLLGLMALAQAPSQLRFHFLSLGLGKVWRLSTTPNPDSKHCNMVPYDFKDETKSDKHRTHRS